MENLPWLRLYTDIVDDARVKMLAFEDRWHFVGVLCLKRSGELESDDLLDRRVAARLGLSAAEGLEVRRRLEEVGLIDEGWQPVSWTKLQCPSDSSTDRVRKHRKKQKKQKGNGGETLPERGGNGDVTPLDLDLDKERDEEEEETLPLTPSHSSPAGSRTANMIAKAWNRRRGSLPPVMVPLAPDLERLTVARIRDLTPEGGNAPSTWESWFARLHSSPFHAGDNPSKWVATYGWVMDSAANVRKVIALSARGQPTGSTVATAGVFTTAMSNGGSGDA